MRQRFPLPYPRTQIDGKIKYLVGPDRWVSRQRAHQIYRGYSPSKTLSAEARERLMQRAMHEQMKYEPNKEATE